MLLLAYLCLTAASTLTASPSVSPCEQDFVEGDGNSHNNNNNSSGGVTFVDSFQVSPVSHKECDYTVLLYRT